jgi:hypothetical protein
MPSQCWLRASTGSPASGSAFSRGVETTQPAAGLIAWGWQTSPFCCYLIPFNLRSGRHHIPLKTKMEGCVSEAICFVLGLLGYVSDIFRMRMCARLEAHRTECARWFWEPCDTCWTRNTHSNVRRAKVVGPKKWVFLTLKWQCWGQTYWQTLRKYCISYEPIGGILFSFKSISSEGWRSWFTIHSATCTELYIIIVLYSGCKLKAATHTH